MDSISAYSANAPSQASELLRAGMKARQEDKAELAYKLFSRCVPLATREDDVQCTARAMIALVENTSLYAPPIEEDLFDYRRRLCLEAMNRFRAIRDMRGVADAMRLLACDQPIDKAIAMLEESLAIMQDANDTTGIIKCLERLGHFTFIAGDKRAGQLLKDKSLAIARYQDDKQLTAQILFSVALTCEDDSQKGVALFEEAATIFDTLGRKRDQARSLTYCALFRCDASQLNQKEAYLLKAITLCDEIGDTALSPLCYTELATIARQRGDEALAKRYDLQSHEEDDVSSICETKMPYRTDLDLETLRELISSENQKRNSGGRNNGEITGSGK